MAQMAAGRRCQCRFFPDGKLLLDISFGDNRRKDIEWCFALEVSKEESCKVMEFRVSELTAEN